ncbi:efflux RND transporter periplasmic adaptor subunit [Planctomycetes bacterium K23_9]|uniref:Peptidase family M50 n=1 Tax=Stieleria marina TaxID=1930275 RepID=A0A517NY33_9BACT|nr:Peptidase family M50 [Planctomycetes bacterium K23_9]
MQSRDNQTIDPSEQKLRIAADVVFWPVRERGQIAYRIEIPSLHKFFRVGYEEYVLISLLDGETTLPQACGLAAARLRDRAPTSQQAKTIVQWLLSNQIVHPSDSPTPVRSPETSRDAGSNWIGKLNPFWMKVPLTGNKGARNSNWIEPIADAFRFLFGPGAVVLGCLLICAAIFSLVLHWDQFTSSAASVASPNNWAWLIGTWLTLKIIHETGHAAAAQRHGASVSEAGVVFILFAPLAYVDVSNGWRLTSRWRRIGISLAGMYVEWIVAALSVILLTQSESPLVQHILHNLIVVAGVSTLLFNANVLMRFDGYFVLADILEMPNLYTEAINEQKRIARRHLFGLSEPTSQYIGWRLVVLRLYGFAAMFWKVTICFSLGIAAATMFAGAGIVFAVFGITLWLGRPIKLFVGFIGALFSRNAASCFRGCLASSALALAAWFVVFGVPMPTSVQVPAVVRFRPDSIVRSGAEGFVTAVHVRDSQRVSRGDLLIELQNPELRQRLLELQIDRMKTETQRRGAQQTGDASLAQILAQQADSLSDQIANVQHQVDSLRLVAIRDGLVHARNIQHLTGTMVHEGDPLLTIAEGCDKEVLAVVAQRQVNTVRQSLGKQVSIRTASFRRVQGTVDRVDPRGATQLDAPSLSATNGGPLAVRPVSNSEEAADAETTRLLEPHFNSRILLDASTASTLPAGMRLQTLIGYRSDTIAVRLQSLIARLWHQSHDAMLSGGE